MKVVKEEESSTIYLIEHFDDLWVLSKYLSQGDVICSKTQRKVALGGDKKKQVTKIMYVELEVKKVELTSHNLDILGIIQNENEFTKVGAHHSLHYQIGETIEIKNQNLNSNQFKSNYSKKLLDEALHSSKNRFIVILCDVDSLVVAKCSKFSMDILYEGSRIGPKKYFSTSKQLSSTDEMFLILQELSLQEFEIFVFAGPGKYKLDLSKLYKKQFASKKILTLDILDAEISSISTVMQELEKMNSIDELQQGKVDSKVEDFLQKLQHDSSKIAYGQDNVIEKINQGACDEVIFSSNKFDDMQENNLGIIQLIEQMNGNIEIIESSSQKGKIVDGLGGIISFLRY